MKRLFDDPAVRRRLLYALLGLELMLLAASIPDHRIHLDEAWIGEQAHSLARAGYVRSELFDGFAANGERIVVYHRLFVLAGSWMVDLFGWSLGSLRAVPLLCGLALMALMWLYARRELQYSPAAGAAVLAVFLLAPLDFEYIKVYRPEMMSALFGFASMYLLHIERSGHRVWPAAVAGVAGSLAMLAHPYGVIYLVAGGAYLLLARRWRSTIAFALASLLPVLPGAYDAASHWELFRLQLANPLVREKTGFTLMSPLVNLLNEHERLFRNARTIPLTALVLLATVAWLRRGAGAGSPVMRYTLLLVLAGGAVMQDKVDRYGILYAPLFALVVAGFLREAVAGDRLNRALRVAGGLVAALFAGYGLYFQTAGAFSEKADVAGVNARIASHIPAGTTVAAPMSFIFNEIDRFDIAATKRAAIECGGSLSTRCLLGFMEQRGATYYVVSRNGVEEERVRDSSDREELARTLVPVARTDDYEVWRRP